MHNLKELKIWQKARELVKEIYLLTDAFPDEEKYGLISQIRRCSVSIPSNIAEGAGRDTQKAFNNFLSISLGSSYELETQLILCSDLKYIEENQLAEMSVKLTEIQKMLSGLKKSLTNKQYINN